MKIFHCHELSWLKLISSFDYMKNKMERLQIKASLKQQRSVISMIDLCIQKEKLSDNRVLLYRK